MRILIYSLKDLCNIFNKNLNCFVELNKVVKSCLHSRDLQENVTLKHIIHLVNATFPLSKFLAQKLHQILPDLEVCRRNRVNCGTFFDRHFFTINTTNF